MSPAERVARGVELLDRVSPGWERRVSLPEFDIRSPCRCVLGQVFAENDDDDGWTGGCAILTMELHVGQRKAVESLGFDIITEPYPDRQRQLVEYNALQAEWSRVIAERQAVTP